MTDMELSVAEAAQVDADNAADEIVRVAELAKLEEIIAANLDDARDAAGRVGQALREIRDRRLYPTTFEAYHSETWGLSSSQAYRLMDEESIKTILSPRGEVLPTGKALRELAPLKDKPEKLIQAWQRALEESDKPTARIVREIVQPMVRRGSLKAVKEIPAKTESAPASVAPEALPDPVVLDLEPLLRNVSAAVKAAVAVGATTQELYTAYQAGFH